MNRLDVVKQKFPDYFEQAISIKDPSNKNKYLLWIAQQLNNKHNSSDISSTIKYFHENNLKFKERDIYKYNDLKEVENLIKDMGLFNSYKNKENSKKIYEDENFLVIRIEDKNSMFKYGSNTKWCVTMKQSDYFESYSFDGCINM